MFVAQALRKLYEDHILAYHHYVWEILALDVVLTYYLCHSHAK